VKLSRAEFDARRRARGLCAPQLIPTCHARYLKPAVREMAEYGLLQVWSTTNPKTDRKATAPVPAGILGGECIRAAA
jgi:hypothetical protein